MVSTSNRVSSTPAGSVPVVTPAPKKMTSAEREALVQKIIKVAIPILIVIGIVALSAATSGAGLAVLGVLVIAATAYMIENKTFNLKEILEKVADIGKEFFTGTASSKSAITNANAPANINTNVKTRNKVDVAVDPKAAFSNEFTKVLQWHNEIKKAMEGDDFPVHGIPCPGPEDELLTCQKIERQGVTTYSYRDEDHKEVYKFNEFADNAVNGARNEDFENRLTLIFDAASFGLKKSSLTPQKQQEIEILLAEIKERKSKELDNLAKVENLLATEPESDEQFMGIYNDAKGIIREAFAEVSGILNDNLENADLVKLENEFIKDQGRPTIVNTFSIDGSAVKLVNIHKPMFSKTLPSTARNEQGLSNALHNLSGTVSTAEDGQEVVNISQATFRHSSIPPIAIENKYERIKGAVYNAGQVVDVIINSALGSLDTIPESSVENPIELNWNNMILLTPLQLVDRPMNRKKGGIWTGQGEQLMLKDSLRGIMAHAGRPIRTVIDGKEVYVKINVSAMNFGCNIAAMDSKHVEGALHTVMTKIPHAPIVRQLNAQGFMEFEIQTDDYLHGQAKKLGKPEISELLTAYCNLKGPGLNEAFSQSKGSEEAQLGALQEELVECLKVYTALADPAEKAKLEKDIDELVANIEKIEGQIRRQAVPIFEGKKAIYTKNQEKLHEIHGDLIEMIDAEISKSTDENEKSQLVKFREVLLNQAKFTDGIINREYRDPKTLLNVQSTYIDTMSLMDSPVSFYCKSGEDRTGIVGLRVDALGAQRATGIQDLDKIVSRLIDTSPGTDTNNANAFGSRGFQITNMIVPEAKKMQIAWQKLISLLAKHCVVKPGTPSNQRDSVMPKSSANVLVYDDDEDD